MIQIKLFNFIGCQGVWIFTWSHSLNFPSWQMLYYQWWPLIMIRVLFTLNVLHVSVQNPIFCGQCTVMRAAFLAWGGGDHPENVYPYPHWHKICEVGQNGTLVVLAYVYWCPRKPVILFRVNVPTTDHTVINTALFTSKITCDWKHQYSLQYCKRLKL